MTPNIPAETLQWAADFWDAHLDTEEVQMVALAFMAGQAAAAPRPSGLTPRQRDALVFVGSVIDDRGGISPTVREIAKGMNWTVSRTHAVIKQLERRGFIAMIPYQPRSITITARA